MIEAVPAAPVAPVTPWSDVDVENIHAIAAFVDRRTRARIDVLPALNAFFAVRGVDPATPGLSMALLQLLAAVRTYGP